MAPLRVDVRSRVRRAPLALRRIERLVAFALRAERVGSAYVQVELCGVRRIARVHEQLTGVRGDTDIVSLEHDRSAPGAPVVGEFWIAPEVAARHAKRLGHSAREEVARLVIHGVLHVLGADHPTDARREGSPMWRRQEHLLQKARRAGLI